MAVTVHRYNHTLKRLLNKEVDYTRLRAALLDGASYNAAHTAISSVWGGSSATVTITIASPGVITWTAHGFSAGKPVYFTTTGALPTGITAGTVYYVIAAGLTTNSFRIATTPGGSAINTSGSQSGTHTGYAVGSNEVGGNGWGIGGQALANVVVSTVTTDDANIDADNITRTASGGNIGPADAAVVYDWGTGFALFYVAFGQEEAADEGTGFSIVWNTGGIYLFTG